jgi:hypothetical protein
MRSKFSWINYLDLYGIEYKLRIQSQIKYKTLLGVFIGLLSILSIMCLSIYFSVEFINKNGMNVLYKKEEMMLPRNNITNFPFLFTLSDNSGKKIPSEGIYSFEVLYFKFNNVKDEQNNSYLVSNVSIIPYKNCEKSDFQGYESQFSNINPKDWFCIPPGKYNLTIFNKFSDLINGFSFLNINLQKCKNSTQNKNCKTEEIINYTIANSKLTLTHLSHQINHYNYVTPNELNLEILSAPVSSSLTKKYFYYLQQTIYETDYGYIFQDRKTVNFMTFDNYIPDTDIGESKSLTGKSYIAQISIRNSKFISYYFRSYTKIQTLLANIGGIIKFVMLISEYFVIYFTHNFFLKNISNLIFEFNEKANQNDSNVGMVLNDSNHFNIPNKSGSIEIYNKNSTQY